MIIINNRNPFPNQYMITYRDMIKCGYMTISTYRAMITDGKFYNSLFTPPMWLETDGGERWIHYQC